MLQKHVYKLNILFTLFGSLRLKLVLYFAKGSGDPPGADSLHVEVAARRDGLQVLVAELEYPLSQQVKERSITLEQVLVISEQTNRVNHLRN